MAFWRQVAVPRLKLLNLQAQQQHAEIRNNSSVIAQTTWNVGFIWPGTETDILEVEVEDTRKTPIINAELKRIDIDVTAVQEKRLPMERRLSEED